MFFFCFYNRTGRITVFYHISVGCSDQPAGARPADPGHLAAFRVAVSDPDLFITEGIYMPCQRAGIFRTCHLSAFQYLDPEVFNLARHNISEQSRVFVSLLFRHVQTADHMPLTVQSAAERIVTENVMK